MYASGFLCKKGVKIGRVLSLFVGLWVFLRHILTLFANIIGPAINEIWA